MKTLQNITTFLSDRSFFEGLHNSLILHRGQHPIYPYVYSYEGKFSFAKVLFGMTFALPVAADVVVSRSWKWFLSTVLRMPETSYGVAHGDELPLLFKLPFQSELKEKDEDFDMSKALVATWGAFAKDGVPLPIYNNSWPLLTIDSPSSDNATALSKSNQGMNDTPIKFFKINRTTEVVDEPFHERSKFWRILDILPFKTLSGSLLTESCNDTSTLPCTKDKIGDDDVDDNFIIDTSSS